MNEKDDMLTGMGLEKKITEDGSNSSLNEAFKKFRNEIKIRDMSVARVVIFRK